MSTIGKADFEKSLSRLESMAKAQSETVAKAQLFHTANDSVPPTWAGTGQDDVTDGDIGIDENGTDYDGVKKALAIKSAKSLNGLTKAETAILKGFNPLRLITAKIEKGMSLTKAERWAIAGGRKFIKALPLMKGDEKPSEAPAPGSQDGANEAPATHAGANIDSEEQKEKETAKGFPFGMKNGDKDEDEDEDDKAEKSLTSAAAQSKTLSKGIEMSPFLHEFVKAIQLALSGTEARMGKSVAGAFAPILERVSTLEKALGQSINEQGDFNKSLAEAVVGIGQKLAATADLSDASLSAPARGPRSLRAVQANGQQQGGVNVMQKSFGPGGLDVSDGALQKSQIVNAMTDMVKAGQLNAVDVIKFETTGEISPVVQQKVVAFAGGQQTGR